MVERFIVLAIMIIELELIEHLSCLNLHISMLFIIRKSYEKNAILLFNCCRMFD